MDVTFWGVRGSIAVADPAMLAYGGNTACVDVAVEDGTRIVLDAGTGIRGLGAALLGKCDRIHVLLTHLHLDHIMGLLFFSPFFDPRVEITVWGPPSAAETLRSRLARYLSAPLSPVEIRDLPARVSFEAAPAQPWTIGSARVTAGAVVHRGTTLGYRIEDGGCLAYLPDHEPALGQDLEHDPAGWISGHDLARGADLLVHDGQYTDAEYAGTRGWGHSTVEDAVRFATRCEARQVRLFHHDPAHDDAQLDRLAEQATLRWCDAGCEAQSLGLAREGEQLTV